MLKFFLDFISLQQVARILTFSIFLFCILMIWFLIPSFTHQTVEIKDYKTLNTSSLEKYELYKRKLDDSPHLIISKDSEINFAFNCDSLTQSICDNEFINSGNKMVVEHAKIVTIKNYKYIQSLKTHDLPKPYAINYVVSNDQLTLNYQQNNNGMAFYFVVILLIPFASILIICYASMEEKITNKLSILYK